MRWRRGCVRCGVTGVWVTGGIMMVVPILWLLQDLRHSPATRPQWKSSSSPLTTRFLPYLVFPVVEETLTTTNMLLETVNPARTRRHQVLALPVHPPPSQPTYHYRHWPPNTQSEMVMEDSRVEWGSHLRDVAHFYEYLRTGQMWCNKLVKFGGVYCTGGRHPGTHEDGHKYLCLDAALELTGNKHPGQCLTLSFGTQSEISFDEAVSDLPCEVHMFDVLDYNPWLARDVEHVHFHPEGLSDRKWTAYYSKLNVSMHYDSLASLVIKLGLSTRPIHVLKVDIEGEEWTTFRNIARNPVMDAVGQVAIEIHTTDLVKPTILPQKEILRQLQERYDVLRMIEARGFRRVLYWDNPLELHEVPDEEGARHVTAGEMLYVNTNWYSVPFKQRLAATGITFRHSSKVETQR